jgi:hypothetical protein
LRQVIDDKISLLGRITNQIVRKRICETVIGSRCSLQPLDVTSESGTGNIIKPSNTINRRWPATAADAFETLVRLKLVCILFDDVEVLVGAVLPRKYHKQHHGVDARIGKLKLRQIVRHFDAVVWRVRVFVIILLEVCNNFL